MIVDRRKDSYDELVVLARDAHTSRTRTNRWTTGIIVSAVAASAVYVSTVNSEIDDLANAKNTAERNVAELTEKLVAAERQRDLYRAQRDVYVQNATWFADMASAKVLGNDIVSLGNRFTLVAGGSVEPGSTVTVTNNVMLVEGSRRFPMTDGDILWIPESDLWVKLEPRSDSDPDDPREAGRKFRRITLHYNALPVGSEATGKPAYIGGGYRYYEERAPGASGNSDCVQLNLHYQSNRPAFAADQDYVDLEVLFRNSEGACPAGGREVIVPVNP